MTQHRPDQPHPDQPHNDNVTPFRPRDAGAPENGNMPPHEPVLNLPPFCKWVAAALIAIYALQQWLPYFQDPDNLYDFAFVPARYTLAGGHYDWPAYASPFTYMLFHGSWLHLGVNALSLVAFGAGLERRLNIAGMAILSLVSGLAAALAHFALYPQDMMPLVGASGAISGLFGGVILYMQEEGFMRRGWRGIAPFVIVWIMISVFFGAFGMPGTEGNIAWVAHIAGLFAGLACYTGLRRFVPSVMTVRGSAAKSVEKSSDPAKPGTDDAGRTPHGTTLH